MCIKVWKEDSGQKLGVWVALEDRTRCILSQSLISDQRLHPPLHSIRTSPSPALRLIKLDQDDTNNWLKLETVRRPNDPYLTPFVAMVSLFPRRAPFGTVYLGSVAKCFSPIPRWTQQHADIMRVMERLHFSQMSGKLTTPLAFFSPLFMVTQFHPLFVPSPPRTREEERADEVACVKCSCLVSVSMTYGGENRLFIDRYSIKERDMCVISA